MNQPALSSVQGEEARLLYEHCDWMVSDLAEYFDVSENAVKNALVRAGAELRSREHKPPPLRMKPCSACLRFLPLALFSGRDAKRSRLASWCMDCTNNPPDKPWTPNARPLTQALNHWRAQ